MPNCEKYESLMSEMISRGSDVTVARDQLALTPKSDSTYREAHSRYQEAERKWKHSRRELEAHKADHRCAPE